MTAIFLLILRSVCFVITFMCIVQRQKWTCKNKSRKIINHFRCTTFDHFIDFVYFPRQNCLRFHHCCNNCCSQIVVTLEADHCRCTACLDLCFQFHDSSRLELLLYLVLLSMVILTSFAFRYPSSPLFLWNIRKKYV